MAEERALALIDTELALSREPEVVLEEAARAAQALKRVIDSKPRKVVMGGETYLEFEDWATVGSFYRIAAGAEDSVPVEVFGVQGAKATGYALLLDTGARITATAYCMRDEENWKGKPWFQLASMAQTRAAAKALRFVLSRVVVLAGYKPTPAEEMDGIRPQQQPDDKPRQPGVAPAIQARSNHFCQEHNVVRFRKGRMTTYAHPVEAEEGKQMTNAEGKPVWCNCDCPECMPTSKKNMDTEIPPEMDVDTPLTEKKFLEHSVKIQMGMILNLAKSRGIDPADKLKEFHEFGTYKAGQYADLSGEERVAFKKWLQDQPLKGAE